MTENTGSIISVSDSIDSLRLGPAFKISTLGPRSQRIFDAITNVVVGQDRAASTLAKCFSRHHAGMRLNPRLPIANAILLGPSGTGKTETAKQLAYYLIDPDAASPPYTLIPGSEFSEKHTVANLIGSPLGYYGSKDSLGVLAQAKIDGPAFWAKLRKNKDFLRARAKGLNEDQLNGLVAELYIELGPHMSVILVDELERAHPNVWNIFLHVMSDGELTMSGEDGSKSLFENSVVLYTSNVGEWEQQEQAKPRAGFDTTTSLERTRRSDDEAYKISREAARKTFPPAFMGRIGKQLVAYRQLTRDDVARASENRFRSIRQLMAKRSDGGIELVFTPEFKDYIVDIGHSLQFGMRPLDQEVESKIMDPLTYLMEAEEIQPGMKLAFCVAGKKIGDKDERKTEICPVL